MNSLRTTGQKSFTRRTFASLSLLLALSTQVACASTTAAADNQAVIEADERLAGIHQYIEETRAQWDIPGVGVAIVYQDEIIHMSGYGVLKQSETAAVNPDSLFGVASTSKAMTAATLAMLVDEGKLDWDDRVIDHLPWFELSDPWVTSEVRIRDLLTHRVGVGRMTGNRLQFMPNASREQVIRQMRYHEFEAPFRSRYVYSNVMYSVAGEVVAAVTGQSWDQVMAERLFQPLNMNRSNTSITQFNEGDNNIVAPHQFIEGELVEIQRRNFDNVGPSASINTSVHDMAQWMRLQLGEPGVYNGTRILSEAVMAEMHRPQVATGRGDRTEPVRAYGFGWALDEYKGLQRSQHGGATDGFNTSLVLVPELDLGIVVITNTFSTYMHALVNHIVDRMAELPSQDWNGEYFERYNAQYERVLAERNEIDATRELNTQASMGAEQLVGTYHDNQYGEVAVFENEQGGLSLHFWNDGVSILDLEHWHHDTYQAAWRNRAQREKFVHFTRGRDGKPASLEVTFTLRPSMLQVGLYPTPYYRDVSFKRQ